MAELVRVVNTGKVPLRIAYNSVPTVLPPGEPVLVEREAAIVHFGDWTKRNFPELQDVSLRDARKIEYWRLRGIYGAGVTFENTDALWNTNKPSVEIYELDGTKVTTVIEDPEGTNMTIEGASERTKEAVLSDLSAQVDRLQEELARVGSEVTPPTFVPEDVPDSAARRKRPGKTGIAVAEVGDD